MQQVTVVDYDPHWPALFEAEAAKIRAILGGRCVALHHIGSTAVPGLCAKPVIDMLPVVDSLAGIEQFSPELEAFGYECMGEFGIAGRRYYRKGGDARTHQIHLFAADSAHEIARHLAVRDYLRAHPDAAANYGALKTKLAAQFPADIDGYCDGKDAFVQALEARALAWMTSQQ